MTPPDDKGQWGSPDPPLRLWQRAGWALLVAAPALWTGWLIWRYGVDVPFLEDWNFCDLLEKMETGTLSLADLFAFDGPQRLFISRVLVLGLSPLTDWNIRAQLGVNWALACVCVANLWRLAWVTGWNRRHLGWGMLAAAALLLFTPAQQENWINGHLVQNVLMVTFLTASLWIAVSVRFPLNYVLTAILSAACTFSLASGMMCWVLSFPLLVYANRGLRTQSQVVWSLASWSVFIVCVGYYFHDFNQSTPPLISDAGIASPLEMAGFFLAYLGGGFAYGTPVPAGALAQVVGGLLLASLGIASGLLWRWRREPGLVARMLPWLLLTLCAPLAAGMTVVLRNELGLRQALSSRYLMFSLMLPVGLMFLAAALFDHWRQTASSAMRVARWAVGLVVWSGVLLTLNLSSALTMLKSWPAIERDRAAMPGGYVAPPGREPWRVAQHHRLSGKALILLVNTVPETDPLERFTTMERSDLQAKAGFLDRKGWLRPPLVRSDAVREMLGQTARDPKEFGAIEIVGPVRTGVVREYEDAEGGEGDRTQTVLEPGQIAPDRIGLSGWAALPDKKRPADAVLLSYDDAKGDPILFAVTAVEHPRSSGDGVRLRPDYTVRSGWIKLFDLKPLPPGADRVRAWAFDAESGRAYPLLGSVKLQR